MSKNISNFHVLSFCSLMLWPSVSQTNFHSLLCKPPFLYCLWSTYIFFFLVLVLATGEISNMSINSFLYYFFSGHVSSETNRSDESGSKYERKKVRVRFSFCIKYTLNLYIFHSHNLAVTFHKS